VGKKQIQNLTHTKRKKERKQNKHCECTKLPKENKTLTVNVQYYQKNEQLKPSKKPKLPAALLNGEEENKKKNKLKVSRPKSVI
jgi:hypothetical protein